MKIYNKYFEIKIIDDEVYYNLNKIEYDDYNELYDKMYKFIEKKKNDRLLLEGEYEPLSHLEQLILLVLSNYYKDLFSLKYNKYLDITFSYNFPIIKQKWIVDRILKIKEKVFNNNMVVLADSVDYLEVEVSNKTSYDLFYKRFGRLIRKGDNIFEVRRSDLDNTLNNWKIYCELKHNNRISDEALEVYKDIYSTFSFNSIKILYKDKEIVNAIYFKDNINKVLYFCILSWNEESKRLSPGIYTYAKGIEYCHNNNYKFSFCYGLQEYKKNLLSDFGVKYE